MRCRTLTNALTLLILFCGGMTACSPPFSPVHTLLGNTMGTSYEVQVAGRVSDPQALLNAIEQELAAIDREMSTWREDSDVSRFNASQGASATELPERLLSVVDAAQRLHSETDGALDITLLPIALAWGFQGTELPDVPDPDTLKQLRLKTGMHLLERSADGTRLGKHDPGVMIDVSALAKGYAVDRLSEILLARGYANFLVEIGGEIRATGARPGGGPWRVAIEMPESDTSVTPLFLRLNNKAIASSGDYRNYFVLDDKRYAHVLDPATGWPAAHGIAAVTVIADDAMTADALATAFMAMPTDKGLALAAKLDVEIMLVLRTKNGDLEHLSNAGFEAMRIEP